MLLDVSTALFLNLFYLILDFSWLNRCIIWTWIYAETTHRSYWNLLHLKFSSLISKRSCHLLRAIPKSFLIPSKITTSLSKYARISWFGVRLLNFRCKNQPKVPETLQLLKLVMKITGLKNYILYNSFFDVNIHLTESNFQKCCPKHCQFVVRTRCWIFVMKLISHWTYWLIKRYHI